ncbi:J domain-containing protein [Salmonella enterica subsp. enterica]|nr:J domain-containing protein [Salmonella enterica subsp. enterica]EGZ4334301.1 J domain-containing protein [Salmonella enterica subsp. enterica serovar Texas]
MTMDVCWDILGIEETIDPESIRKAYLSLLPFYHPESDPEGFKQLRAAYEAALLLSQNNNAALQKYPTTSSHIRQILAVFDELLLSASQRFQPEAWQQFIAYLNSWPIEVIDDVRWPLFWKAQEVDILSFSCLELLSQRLEWGWDGYNYSQVSESQWAKWDEFGGWEEEAVQDIIAKIDDGDLFDYRLLSSLPFSVQDYVIKECLFLSEMVVSSPANAERVLEMHRVLPVPDDAAFVNLLIFWHSHYNEGVLVVVDKMMQQWPDDSGCVFLLELWHWFRTDGCKKLWLWWNYRHSPECVPLLIFALDYYCYPREDVAPGEYKKTKILCRWALKQMNSLPAPALYLLTLILSGASGQQLTRLFGKKMSDHPLWSYYLAVENLAKGIPVCHEWLADNPQDRQSKMIVEALRGQTEELSRYSDSVKLQHDASPDHHYVESMATAKIVFLLAILACAALFVFT